MNQKQNEDILEIIRELPSITAREIYTFVPHIPKGTVSAALHNLKMQGIVVETGRKSLPTAKGERAFVTYAVSDSPAPTPLVRKLKNNKPTDAALQMQIEELRRQVSELEAWKKNALERYPDLGVDPLTLKARQIVAAEVRASGDKHLADLVLSGAKDDTMLVKVTAKALEMNYD
jgi:hypothetical protein